MSSIQIADTHDFAELYETLVMMHSEAPFGRIDEKKAEDAIFNAITQGRVAVIRDGNKIVATSGLILSPYLWYSTDLFLTNVWTFVHPDHRRTGYAHMLQDWEKEQADLYGYDLLTGVFSTKQTSGKIKLFARKFDLLGALFLHRAKRP